ncbi:MAG TPA: CvpA family protein [Candidatus Atribacteria bacterium]|nr:CvpA family protein [Candidatus Atribacteria bacterium]
MTVDWYSIIGLVILGINIIRSAFRGFSKEVLGLAGFLGGVVIGLQYYPVIGGFFAHLFGRYYIWFSPLGFLLLFLPLVLASSWLGVRFRRVFQNLDITWIDSILGSFAGIAKGILWALILTLLLLNLSYFPVVNQLIYRSSFYLRLIQPLLVYLYEWVLKIPHLQFLQGILQKGIGWV